MSCRPVGGRSAAALPGLRRRSSCAGAARAEVLVLEREAEAGGIPRHAQHQGFGLRDLRRPLSGPALRAPLRRAGRARRRRAAHRDDGHGLVARRARSSSPARAAASARARRRWSSPRAAASVRAPARLVPGSRPEGVMTTGTLQQLVYLKGLQPGQAGARGRRRARELLRAAHARPWRRAGGGHGHRAAAPPVARAVPRGRRAALAHPALDAHGGQRHPRPPARGGGGAHGPRQRARCARWRATPSSSRPTGSPTTSWP